MRYDLEASEQPFLQPDMFFLEKLLNISFFRMILNLRKALIYQRFQPKKQERRMDKKNIADFCKFLECNYIFAPSL